MGSKEIKEALYKKAKERAKQDPRYQPETDIADLPIQQHFHLKEIRRNIERKELLDLIVDRVAELEKDVKDLKG